MNSVSPDAVRAHARAKTPSALIEMLRSTDFTQLGHDLERLLAIEQWARGQVGFAEGDAVRIRKDWIFPGKSRAPGWKPFRECLVPGATAKVIGVTFMTFGDPGWRIDIVLDQEWSVSDPQWLGGEIKRYWHGTADSTPEGYEPPSPYTQEHYPEGRRGIFMMRAGSLEKIS